MRYTNNYQKRKAKAFGNALDQYEQFKLELKDQLNKGLISNKTYEDQLKTKAKELDL